MNYHLGDIVETIPDHYRPWQHLKGREGVVTKKHHHAAAYQVHGKWFHPSELVLVRKYNQAKYSR